MDVQERDIRDKEIDPDLYYPLDVDRELTRVFPDDFKLKLK